MAVRRFCDNCHNTGVVYEAHVRRPWSGNYGCGCGDAGIDCPVCHYDPQEPDLSGVLAEKFRCEMADLPQA
jgi:hypothetical protein